MAIGKDVFFLLFLNLNAFIPLLRVNAYVTSGIGNISEEWGYVEVRPKAHMFWWLYKSPQRVDDPAKPWPVILWLQGGPGGSGVGFGNFLEIGPLDVNLEPRNSTWLQKADLLFVDSPVGTGYSYVEDENLAVTTDEEAATDLTFLLKQLFNADNNLQKSPLYIFAESYGGKFAVTLGISVLKAIEARELKLHLGGVALGDSWISPEDFVFSWGPLLKDMSRIDSSSLNESNSLAEKIRQQLAEGRYAEATDTWSDLEHYLGSASNDVDFYNFLLDYANDPVVLKEKDFKGQMAWRYLNYFSRKYSSINGAGVSNDLPSLMNGPIRKKLRIIPENVTWGGQTELVLDAMTNDFMKPRIEEVDELLARGVNVTIYNGQVDLICATKGVEAWVNKLKWDGLQSFLSLGRTPLFCGDSDRTTKGFVKSYKNLFFYWILGAGHFVPVDQPCVSLQMVGNITQSPNNGVYIIH
ncbi:hypothetical protein ACH5RR_005532 [Cinchona calisaya]|uniref:Carboxypeptidase n=1 Tax=Cinchona calisaya TaxID=153742 RepID=A0ABD3ALQ0_9GENT